MSQNKTDISRRQLFGGLRPKPATSMGQGGNQFQPSEPLTASPGLNLDDLPPVHQATLVASQVRDLVRDLSREATGIRLSSASESAENTPEVLAAAAEKFLAREIKRLQIRYTWQGKFWIDTLDQTADGIRLVRIAHASQF